MDLDHGPLPYQLWPGMSPGPAGLAPAGADKCRAGSVCGDVAVTAAVSSGVWSGQYPGHCASERQPPGAHVNCTANCSRDRPQLAGMACARSGQAPA
jgi:hypothetical protein